MKRKRGSTERGCWAWLGGGGGGGGRGWRVEDGWRIV